MKIKTEQELLTEAIIRLDRAWKIVRGCRTLRINGVRRLYREVSAADNLLLHLEQRMSGHKPPKIGD